MKSRADIVSIVAEKTGERKGVTEKIVEGAIDAISEVLLSGDDVRLPGFGTFTVKNTVARQGRNPSTGATVEIPAGKKIVFKPSSDLKGKL